MVGNETIQPGTSIDKNLWREFRNDVRDRRGRINGVLATELENAIRAYLEGSRGGDVTDEIRRLREDLDEVRDAVVDGPKATADGGDPYAFEEDDEKEKNSQENPNRSRSTGDETADRELTSDDDLLGDLDVGGDDRSTVEKRTDAALAELVANHHQFTLDDLDDAIETGADVHSKPTLRDYRERVFDRLGGVDAVSLPSTAEKPIESRVFFVDVDDANASRAANLAKTDGETTIEEAAREYDVDVERVESALPKVDLAAIRVRDRGLGFEEAAREVGADVDAVREKLPDDFVDEVEADDRGETGEAFADLDRAQQVRTDADDSIEASIETTSDD